MTTTPSAGHTRHRFSSWNWRVALLRIVVNGTIVWLVLWAVPAVDAEIIHPLAAFALIAGIYGLLDAYVRPALDRLFMPFAVQSYGAALVAVDVVLLTLLILLSGIGLSIEVSSWLWVVVAGLLVGILKLVAAGFFGLTPPVIPDETGDLKGRP